MNTREVANGLGLGVAGISLQAGGFHAQASYGLILPGALTYLVGTGLLLAGLANFAKAKGRSPAWGVFAFFSVIGLIVLFALKDAQPEDEPGADTEDEGEKLVDRAAKLDFTGEWDEAVAIFESVLSEPKYQVHHLYAKNCIKRIREKQSFAN